MHGCNDTNERGILAWVRFGGLNGKDLERGGCCRGEGEGEGAEEEEARSRRESTFLDFGLLHFILEILLEFPFVVVGELGKVELGLGGGGQIHG